MARAKRNSPILAAVHETALGLHRAGVISKQSMREFDVLCKLEVHEMPPQEIRALREKTNMSQSVFAKVLNISASTVQKWEVGDKKPSGASLKLLNLIESKGVEVLL